MDLLETFAAPATAGIPPIAKIQAVGVLLKKYDGKKEGVLERLMHSKKQGTKRLFSLSSLFFGRGIALARLTHVY